MYESTPQHIIDEEAAHPGPVAEWLDTSSDSDTSSSSSSDSDGSSGSNTTAKRFKRVMRGGRRRRKSSSGSKDTAEMQEKTHTPSIDNSSNSPIHTEGFTEEPRSISYGSPGDAVDGGHEADDEHLEKKRSRRGSVVSHVMSKREKKKERKREEKRERKAKREQKSRRNGDDTLIEGIASGSNEKGNAEDPSVPRRVDFADNQPSTVTNDAAKRPSPFNLRHISNFTPPVFMAPTPTGSPAPAAAPVTRGSVPRVKYGIRRTNSLPDRLNSTHAAKSSVVDPVANAQNSTILSRVVTEPKEREEDEEENISRTTAVVLLLASTGLVALCAEFLVDSINEVIETSPLSEAFVGLIILPIVGNAAEHVTAVAVASKNKMDLAIGVAVGSSIQIALFVTPFIVLLGWAMGKDMSLYFTLFETVSLFVSAFIVSKFHPTHVLLN